MAGNETNPLGETVRGTGLLALVAIACSGCHLLADLADHEAYDPSLVRAGSGTVSAGGGGLGGGVGGGDGGEASGGAGGGGGMGTHCGPRAPRLLASKQKRPGAIAIDGDEVFWIDEATGNTPGRILRTLKDSDDDRPNIVVDGLSNPVSLRVYSSYVIYTNDVGGTGGEAGVFRVPKGGGAITALQPEDRFGAGTLSYRSEAGAAYSEVVGADSARIRRHDLPTKTGCYLYDSGAPGSIAAMATHGVGLHFADSSMAAIMRVGYACGDPSSVFAPNQVGVRAMTAGTIQLHWLTANAVFSQALDMPGSMPTQVGEGNDLGGIRLVPPGDLIVTSIADGTVTRITGNKEILACNQGGPYRIIDSTINADTPDELTSLFWTNRDSGEVMRLDL